MKHIIPEGREVRKVFVVAVIVAMATAWVTSCEPDNNNLGVDIFPPQDTILVYTDTITDLQTRLVTSRPRVTSVTPDAPDTRTYFLGTLVDSITGSAKAEIVTEFGLNRAGYFGDEPVVDSLTLTFYIADVLGDTTSEMRLMVYEFLDSLDLDSSYYSDYDVTGKYDPEPILDEIIVPTPDTYYEFPLDHPELLNRILDATNPDDSTFIYNSRMQRIFPGLYITTAPVSEGGALAKVQLANDVSGLKFKYFHDTIVEIAADTIPMSTFNLSFNEFYAQKVNIFHHDFSGTSIASFVDNPDAVPSMGYVQGMAGVNVKVSVPDLSLYTGDGIVAINAARLVFYVVPDSISGIPEEEYPARLMIETKQGGEFQPLYDEVIGTERIFYGMLTQSNENSAFLPPVFYYGFNVARHFQSVISGDIENSDLYIFVNNPATTDQIIKFWSNHSGRKGGLRLELIYTKF